MTKMILRSALVICILAIAAQASAEVVLLSQSRSVSGGGTLTQWSECCGGYWIPEEIARDYNTISAPDFGLFEEEISIDLTSPYPTLGSLFSVTQDSEIQIGHFSIHGNAAVTASWPFGNQYFYFEVYSRANSHFEVLFEVSTPTSFSLVGSLTNTYAGTDPRDPAAEEVYIEQNASLQLDRDGVPYLSFGISNNPFYWPPREIAVSEVGILEPGTYTLTVWAATFFGVFSDEDNATGNSSSSFDIDFFLETPVATDEMAWGQVKALYR